MRTVLATVVVCLLTLTGCGDDADGSDPSAASSSGGSEEATIPGVIVEDGQTNGHTDQPVDYPAAPPSGGDHAPTWLNCGFYDDPVPDENAVHALEHGVVWFAHRPGLSDEQLSTLRALYDLDPDRVIVSPYSGLDADVVVVAWGRRLVADGVDDPRLVDFLDAFVNGAQAPEPRAPCNGGVSVG